MTLRKVPERFLILFSFIDFRVRDGEANFLLKKFGSS